MKTISKMTVKEYKEFLKNCGINDYFRDKNVKKSQNSIKKAIDLSKKINDMPTTPTKRSKKHEHKPDNNIRLQITIDCRIL